MFFKLAAVLLVSLAAAEDLSFTYNGFQSVNLSLDGLAGVTPNGLLRLTNDTKQNQGHAFYPNPVNFKSSPNGTAFSFSSTFVFAIRSEYADLSGHGIVFVVAPTRGLPGALPSQYLGLFNEGNDGNATNHVFAVELDTIQSKEFNDINDNHVGIDINGLHSATSTTAGYYAQNNGGFQNLTLISGQPMQVWVDYDGTKKQINVTMAPINVDKPQFSLLSLNRDLSPILNETMYVGFSSSTGSVRTSHYVLGWSFKMNGQAQEIVTSKLPKLPRMGGKKRSKLLTIGVPILSVSLVLLVVSGLIYFIRRKRKFAELLEDWELEYGPQRFKYKELYIATKGFKEKELLGAGGFGKVYRGILPSSKIEIAVKRVSHESRQGMKEFIAEVVSIGRLRHRNLVPLLGYCRRKGELLLVYDYMSNGSLDKYLYDQPVVTLNWSQRFRVIRGVASGLFYLHEGWEQVVIHRDVKASNVLLDGELNARLGDFGLARLYDHGTDPQTTHIVGTLGYLAPEHTRSGRATTSTDVFAFGAFVLEVACGRRPIEAHGPDQDLILVDWVFSFWNRGAILEARDQNLSSEFVAEEVELVLKLGLLCSHSEPTARPSMRQVVQYLEGDIALPELSLLGLSSNGLTFAHHEGFDDFAMSYSSSLGKGFSHSSHAPESAFLSGGR
ncbi:L-type lectin-domain containing receptor kinase IV.1-like [Prunus yedoensis var. nudiflora]|uniref:non-specific serine/threonine protein kinase n=1 Tax=Prunus yedoensis var. nudiflora TaxID=2094558 RepID=A0A314XMG1_PRUYE|nr:L-type lectin-domain containing receptor kinase IV.1-like [Prunus yedoensis var. nudiflora]